jgi:hypothetical protein
MPRKPAPPVKPDDPAQYQRFPDMAKEVEADKSPDAMDRVFDKLKPVIKQERPAKPPKRGG